MPPCYPASWLVFPKPFHASDAEIQAIYNLYHNNPNFNGNGNYRTIPPAPATPVFGSGYFHLNSPTSSSSLNGVSA